MKHIYIFIIGLLIVGCGSTKEMPTAEDLNALKSAVENKKFRFEATSANPIGLANVRGINNLLPPGSVQSNISLIGNSNYFIVDNETVQLDMPYFGEQEVAKVYNQSDAGLKFKGKAKKFTIKFDERKMQYTINLVLDSSDENLNIMLVMYPNKKARLDVSSSIRSAINYYGDWKVAE